MSFNFTITRVEKYANRVVAEEHAPSVEGIREQEVDVSLQLKEWVEVDADLANVYRSVRVKVHSVLNKQWVARLTDKNEVQYVESSQILKGLV